MTDMDCSPARYHSLQPSPALFNTTSVPLGKQKRRCNAQLMLPTFAAWLELEGVFFYFYLNPDKMVPLLPADRSSPVYWWYFLLHAHLQRMTLPIKESVSAVVNRCTEATRKTSVSGLSLFVRLALAMKYCKLQRGRELAAAFVF